MSIHAVSCSHRASKALSTSWRYKAFCSSACCQIDSAHSSLPAAGEGDGEVEEDDEASGLDATPEDTGGGDEKSRTGTALGWEGDKGGVRCWTREDSNEAGGDPTACRVNGCCCCEGRSLTAEEDLLEDIEATAEGTFSSVLLGIAEDALEALNSICPSCTGGDTGAGMGGGVGEGVGEDHEDNRNSGPCCCCCCCCCR